MGLDPLLCPLFVEEAVSWTLPDAGLYDAMMLTSARAVRLAGPQISGLSGLRVYAVGEPTAAAATAAGLAVAAIGDAGADALLARAAADGVRRLLWLCGTERRALILPAGVQIDPLAVYAMPPTIIPAYWDTLLARSPVALAHSARAASLFADRAASFRASIALVTISAAVADAAGVGWQWLAVADRPGDGAMLALAAKLCQDTAMDSGSRDSR
jgi:uroporphyrinogen-III synthase